MCVSVCVSCSRNRLNWQTVVLNNSAADILLLLQGLLGAPEGQTGGLSEIRRSELLTHTHTHTYCVAPAGVSASAWPPTQTSAVLHHVTRGNQEVASSGWLIFSSSHKHCSGWVQYGAPLITTVSVQHDNHVKASSHDRHTHTDLSSFSEGRKWSAQINHSSFTSFQSSFTEKYSKNENTMQNFWRKPPKTFTKLYYCKAINKLKC